MSIPITPQRDISDKHMSSGEARGPPDRATWVFWYNRVGYLKSIFKAALWFYPGDYDPIRLQLPKSHFLYVVSFFSLKGKKQRNEIKTCARRKPNATSSLREETVLADRYAKVRWPVYSPQYQQKSPTFPYRSYAAFEDDPNHEIVSSSTLGLIVT